MRLDPTNLKAAAAREMVNGQLGEPVTEAPSPDWSDIDKASGPHRSTSAGPRVVDAGEVLKAQRDPVRYLVEPLVTRPGLWLVVGMPKSGKTLLAAQLALTCHAGHPLLDYYPVPETVAVLVVEQDDPSGAASLQTILQRSAIPIHPERFLAVDGPSFTLGADLILFLREQIEMRGVRLVVLDSYTALRPARRAGGDLVKTEQQELSLLDQLAKASDAVILLVHHESKGSSGQHWAARAGGSYIVAGAAEGLISISRFHDLSGSAPERLIRIQGRHIAGAEILVRFHQETLSYSFVLEGPAAAEYPALQQIQASFGSGPFEPKELLMETGWSRQTVHRLLGRLIASGAIAKRGFGKYALEARV